MLVRTVKLEHTNAEPALPEQAHPATLVLDPGSNLPGSLEAGLKGARAGGPE